MVRGILHTKVTPSTILLEQKLTGQCSIRIVFIIFINVVHGERRAPVECQGKGRALLFNEFGRFTRKVIISGSSYTI